MEIGAKNLEGRGHVVCFFAIECVLGEEKSRLLLDFREWVSYDAGGKSNLIFSG